MSDYFPPLAMWRLTEGAWKASLDELLHDGARGTEGVALWLGSHEGDCAKVTHLVILCGSGVIKRPDLLVITSALMNVVTDLAHDYGVRLLGQIHSHGHGYSTDLSPTDRAYGITVPWYLSLVAPDFAQSPSIRVAQCGVHIYEQGCGYRRLLPPDAEQRVVIVPGPPPPILVAGEATGNAPLR